jgi:hypothetical protein
MSNNEDIKPIFNKVMYAYMQDPQRPDRIVTVARELRDNGTKVAFGIAVCKPNSLFISRWDDENSRGTSVYEKRNGDIFNKKMGRTIAEGRMRAKPEVIDVPEGTHPMDAIRLWLADSANTTVNGLDMPRFMRMIATVDLLRTMHHHNKQECDSCLGDGTPVKEAS